MDIVSTQKFLIGSPRKLREVVYLIKRLQPQDAVDRLPFTGKKASESLRKVIMTAIANAKQKGANPDELIFKEIQINEGPRLKRYQPGARGRAKPYKKRMSHIRVVLTTKEIKKTEAAKESEKDEMKKDTETVKEVKKENKK